jgi:hypothetical protein
MKILCPFCDSGNVEKIEIEERFPIPFCEDAVVKHEIYRCNDCEEEGDFSGTLDKILTKVITEANVASAPELLDALARSGITMTYLEKALRLPFRTTARWKRGEISHSALALLRLIRFSPALLEVADDNFSERAQASYHASPGYRRSAEVGHEFAAEVGESVEQCRPNSKGPAE